MKKLLLVFLPFFLCAQKTQELKFHNTLKDFKSQAKTLEVLDNRTDKNIGEVSYKGQQYTMIAPEAGIERAIIEKFNKSNSDNKGDKHYVLMIEKLKVSSAPEKIIPKYNDGTAILKVALFLKKNDSLYFVNRIQDKSILPQRTVGELPKAMSDYFSSSLMSFMFASYKLEPIGKGLALENISNYFTTLNAKVPLSQKKLPYNAVYMSVEDLLNVRPKTGFGFEKNDDGEMVKAYGKDEKIPARKIFAYTEAGKTYIRTALTTLELEKDEIGYYIMANKNLIFPPQTDSTLLMYGAIGGIAMAIDQNAKNNKALKSDREKVYIDPLTGKFLF